MVRCPSCKAGNVVMKTGITRCWKCFRVLWVVKK